MDVQWPIDMEHTVSIPLPTFLLILGLACLIGMIMAYFGDWLQKRKAAK